MGKSETTQAPEQAYTAVLRDEGWVVGLATENEPGYVWIGRTTPYPTWPSEDAAWAVAHDLNKTIEVSRERALCIALSSMFPQSAADHAERRSHWAT